MPDKNRIPQAELQHRIITEMNRLGGRATTRQMAAVAFPASVYATAQAAAFAVSMPIKRMVSAGLIQREKEGVYVVPDTSVNPTAQSSGVEVRTTTGEKITLDRSRLIIAKMRIESAEISITQLAKELQLSLDTFRRSFERVGLSVTLPHNKGRAGAGTCVVSDEDDFSAPQKGRVADDWAPLMSWDMALAARTLSMPILVQVAP